jgi:transcriptional regulator with XRE-family HTH domain
MGSEKWTDKHFGKRVKNERDHRGWSQADMAKKLSDHGIQPMHPTTVAKIEAGERSVRINEAVGIADLFEISLDSLLGRKPRAERDLEYALGALLDAVYTSLEDIPADFAGYDTLARHGREVFTYLNTAREVLGKLEDQLSADMEPWTSSAIGAWSEQLAERIVNERKPTAKEPQE